MIRKLSRLMYNKHRYEFNRIKKEIVTFYEVILKYIALTFFFRASDLIYITSDNYLEPVNDWCPFYN